MTVLVSTLFSLAGDWATAGGAGGAVGAGVSDVDDSESELEEADPELDELPLLLESEEDPELLSELLLLA